MELYTNTPQFFNDLCDEVRLFENVKRIEKTEDVTGEKVLRHFFFDAGGNWRSEAEYYENGAKKAATVKEAAAPDACGALTVKKLKKRLVKQNVYELFKQMTGKTPPWGSLTGIRPAKLFREIALEHGTEGAERAFTDEFDVSVQKTALAKRIAENQKPFIEEVAERDLDVYVGIPFCVSRCKYCSFVSRDLRRAGTMKTGYLACLKNEITAMRDVVEKYRIRAIYVGGGTPTALEAEELDGVLQTVCDAFPNPLEFTVEAGRPDTVTKEKLAVIAAYGVNRISINAQTMKQRTLELIGREHTVQDFRDAFALARDMGFGNINTDIILGLPEEALEDVKNTLETMMTLCPENVTVHTLAVKNASEFALEQKDHFAGADVVGEMVELAEKTLMHEDYEPYYLYRQKYMSGNTENVGFARPGYICRYNIDNMEETVSVLAFGAGAISKRLFNRGERIERAANVKDVEHYIGRTDEMAERKRELFLD